MVKPVNNFLADPVCEYKGQVHNISKVNRIRKVLVSVNLFARKKSLLQYIA